MNDRTNLPSDISAVVGILQGVLIEVSEIDKEIARLRTRREELLKSASAAHTLTAAISNLSSSRLEIRIDSLPARKPDQTKIWEDVKKACSAHNIHTLGELAKKSVQELRIIKTLAPHLDEIKSVLSQHGLTLSD